MTEEDGDVDKHEEITDDDCDYISFTFPIDLIHNRSLQNYKFTVAFCKENVSKM